MGGAVTGHPDQAYAAALPCVGFMLRVPGLALLVPGAATRPREPAR